MPKLLARFTIVVCLCIVAVGCKKAGDRAAPSAAKQPGGAVAATAGKAPGAIKVDKTAGQDGALTGDSADDGVISLTIDGPVAALCVVSVDASGLIAGGQQWDTVVDQQPMPTAWGTAFSKGEETWQLGVEEGGNIHNAANGSLTPLAAGRHSLTLLIGDGTHLPPQQHFMVLAERPDHSVAKSNVFTM